MGLSEGKKVATTTVGRERGRRRCIDEEDRGARETDGLSWYRVGSKLYWGLGRG